MVTGPCSTVGRVLIPKLVSEGAFVHGVGATPKNKLMHPPSMTTYTELDLAAQDFSVPVAATVLFHLAATPGDRATVHTQPDLVYSNLLIDMNVVRSAARVGLERFIFASSATAATWQPTQGRFCEPLPDGFFGHSKRLTELYLTEVSNVSAISARLYTLYGSNEKNRSLISNWIDAANRKNEISVFGGEQERNFVHIEDACRALKLLGEGSVQGTVDIAGRESMSVMEAAQIFAKQHTSDIKIVRRPYPFGEWKHQRGDPRPLMTLGWSPENSLSNYLAATLR